MTAKEEFEWIASKWINRDGVMDLLDWLGKTDFYTAPASTRFHGACEGGLVQHSLAVFERLKQLCDWYDCDCNNESIAIVALFHDLCKVGIYKTEMRWRKDANQQWEQYATYKRQEDYAFGGHGSKSVYLVMNFIKLTPEEAAAINSHMASWDSSPYNNAGDVFEQNKLAWLLHVADEAATYIDKT